MNVFLKCISIVIMLMFVSSSIAQTDTTSSNPLKGDEIELNMPLLFILLGGLVIVLLFLYKMIKRPNPHKDQLDKK
ncbi:MAG: TRAP-type C4-dicarboxylate transport system permease small subunit [Parvicellaceae bacterium]|jgi:TRAP-type C4-dicarboxylate transport system permease small subunit